MTGRKLSTTTLRIESESWKLVSPSPHPSPGAQSPSIITPVSSATSPHFPNIITVVTVSDERASLLGSNSSTNNHYQSTGGVVLSTTTSTPGTANTRYYLEDLKSSSVGFSEILEEARYLVPNAWPISLGYLLQMSLQLTAIFTLGQLSTHALASMALATLFCNVSGFSLIVGMATGFETLCSQAFGEFLAGKCSRTVVGKHIQPGFLVLIIMCIPIATLWLFAEQILLMTGQDPEIAHMSAQFTRYMLPGLVPYAIAETAKRFLQCQGIMSAPFKIILIVSPINMILQYVLGKNYFSLLFSYEKNMTNDTCIVWSPVSIGPVGSPLAISICYTLIAVMLLIYIRYFEGSEAWGGWDPSEALSPPKIWTFIKLGIPGVMMTCSEWWAFEILALASGLMGPAFLAAQAIVLNACSLTYMLPLGLAISATTRIGNSMGASYVILLSRCFMY
jgi:multidrug resistance protein, MATE family